MRSTIITEQMDVPADSFFQVAAIIVDNEISHEITATDDQDETITVQISYGKNQRKVIHKIKDIIDDYNDDDEEEDEDEEDDD